MRGCRDGCKDGWRTCPCRSMPLVQPQSFCEEGLQMISEILQVIRSHVMMQVTRCLYRGVMIASTDLWQLRSSRGPVQ